MIPLDADLRIEFVCECARAYTQAHACKARGTGTRLKTRSPVGKARDEGSFDQEGALVKFNDGLIRDDSTVCGARLGEGR